MLKYCMLVFCIVCVTVYAQGESSVANTDYVDTFKYGTPTQKISTVARIRATRNDADIALLVSHYPDELNSRVKIEIIRFFLQVRNDLAKNVIAIALDDADDNIRREAYSLCSIYPDLQFETRLVTELSNQSGAIRDSIINSLGMMKSSIASDYLLEIYPKTETQNNTRVEILRYFSETKDPKGETIAKEAAVNTGEAAFVRNMGIIALGAYPSQENYDELQKILIEDKADLTARVMFVLPNFSAFGDVRSAIVEAARNDSDSVRLYAVRALKEYKNDPDIEALLLYRMKTDGLESITLEILDIYKEYAGEGMTAAIKSLAESSANKKIQLKAREILDANGVEYRKR